ncbi:MAG: aldo/keto reductase [Thermoleophilia bacterium]|nr:aldo/keto reductase [Thermoleophilia bacterium]
MPLSDRRALGASGLLVSPLCLGANAFGWAADEAASFAVLDAYVEMGGNFIDTANIYSAWVPGNRGGESETIIGRWLAERDRPDDLVIATKVGMGGGPLFPKGLSRDRIRAGAEQSLERLGVDRIDLFWAHEDDADTPFEETMGAFEELINEGVVGMVAASNIPAGRLAEALRVSDTAGLARYVAVQPHFNLLDRAGYDRDLEDLCRAEDLGVTPYYALARGFLAGKYRPGAPLPDTPRAPGVQRDYMNDRGWNMLAGVERVAAAHDATAAQVALAWLMARPGVTSPIASATSPEQLRELAGSADLALTADECAALDAAGA